MQLVLGDYMEELGLVDLQSNRHAGEPDSERLKQKGGGALGGGRGAGGRVEGA